MHFVSECPSFLQQIDRFIPQVLKNILKCNVTDNCFGIYCCVDFEVPIPLSDLRIQVTFPVYFEMDPCKFAVEAGIGSIQSREELLKYEWGKWHCLKKSTADF